MSEHSGKFGFYFLWGCFMGMFKKEGVILPFLLQECDIMNTLASEPFINQRILAELSGHSLGVVNHSIKEFR